MVVDRSSDERDFYVASCIDKPKNFDTFSSPRIDFDAHSSAGLYFDPVSGLLYNISRDSLRFSWNFYHRGVLEGSCVGMGDRNCEGGAATEFNSVWYFSRLFSTINENSATLTVSVPSEVYNPIIDGSFDPIGVWDTV